MLKNGTKRILLVIVILMGILVICTNNAYAINIAPSNNTLNQTTDANNIQQINGIGVLNNTTNRTTNTVNNTTTTPIVSNKTKKPNITIIFIALIKKVNKIFNLLIFIPCLNDL